MLTAGSVDDEQRNVALRNSFERPEGITAVHKMSPLRRALAMLFSLRAWKQLLMVLNFFAYDTYEQSVIATGKNVRLAPTVSVRNGARIAIGDGSEIGQGCNLWAGDTHGRIDIGDHALLAPNVFVTTSNYRFDDGPGPVMHAGSDERDVKIGANTWIGTGVVIVAGAVIGDGAIIAAGSVVTGTVPAMTVAGGIPARVLRDRGSRSNADG